MSSSVPFEPGATGRCRATLEELVRAKRPGPVTSVEEFMAVGEGIFESDEEVDDFVVTVRQWRRARCP
jgi:hypothetical protein